MPILPGHFYLTLIPPCAPVKSIEDTFFKTSFIDLHGAIMPSASVLPVVPQVGDG